VEGGDEDNVAVHLLLRRSRDQLSDLLGRYSIPEPRRPRSVDASDHSERALLCRSSTGSPAQISIR
jgi:hypothetical protein